MSSLVQTQPSSTTSILHQATRASGCLVQIHDRAVLGGGSTILPGVQVGEGAVLGGGSVLTKSIPAVDKFGQEIQPPFK